MLSLESRRVFQNLFCFVLLHNKSLNDWSLGGTVNFVSLESQCSSRETLGFLGNKIHCSPRDQSLSVNCYIHEELYTKLSF